MTTTKTVMLTFALILACAFCYLVSAQNVITRSSEKALELGDVVRIFPSNAESALDFREAVKMLSSSDELTRVGGIYALEKVMKYNSDYYWQVNEIFMWHLRRLIPIKGTEGNAGQRPEVNAIMTVLGRNNDVALHQAQKRLDLSGLNFRGLWLKDANFDGFYFADSDFTGATFINVSMKDTPTDRAIGLQEAIAQK